MPPQENESFEVRSVPQRSVLRYTGLTVLVLLMVYASVVVYTHLRWAEDQFGGEVGRVEAHGFILADGAFGEQYVLVDAQTTIERGRHRLADGVREGERVLVIGRKYEDGNIHASLVRIVEDRPW